MHKLAILTSYVLTTGEYNFYEYTREIKYQTEQFKPPVDDDELDRFVYAIGCSMLPLPKSTVRLELMGAGPGNVKVQMEQY